VHAAVHAWYEGHVHAHIEVGKSVDVIPLVKGEFPPPFPASDDEELWHIVDETGARGFMSLDAALTFAAALAWETGYRRGKECPGCQAFGHHGTQFAASIRDGNVTIAIGQDRRH
jgi:hypothetical protein